MQRPRQKVVDLFKGKIAEGIYLPGQRLPTLLELAAEFDVSRGTVCNALEQLIAEGIVVKKNGSGCVLSENIKTPERQLQPKMAFLTPGIKHQHGYVKILEGMAEVASSAGREVTFFSHDNQPEKLLEIVQNIVNARYDGVGLIPIIGEHAGEINHRIIDMLEEANCNYATADCPVISGSVIRGSFIGSDNYNPVRKMIAHLIAEGYRKFASIRISHQAGSPVQRVTGMLDQLRFSGLQVCEEWQQVIDDVPLAEQGRSNLHRLLALPEKPEVIFCAHDIIAANVMDEFAKIGGKIPDDLAVCGFDDSEIAAFLQLTSIRQDFHQMGVSLGQMLLQNLDNNLKMIRQEFLACEVVYRKSTSKSK